MQKYLLIPLMLAVFFCAGIMSFRPAHSEFAQQGAYGGVSTGSANAQVNTPANIAAMSQLRGVTISFVVGPGLTNTGPATIAVGGLSPIAVERMNSGTLLPLGGAEMPSGKMVEAFYDGTEFVLKTDYTGGAPVGTESVANYGTADPGYMLEYGECLSSADNPAIATKLGTTYNAQDGCTSGQTGLPDRRGRTVFGLDNMGGTAANRITTAGGNFAGTTLGAAGGQQNHVVAQANLAAFQMSGAGSGSGTGSISGTASGTIYVAGPSQSSPGNGNAAGSDLMCCLWGSGGGNNNADLGVTGSASVNVSTSDAVNSGGSGTPLPTLSNGQIAVYEIKL